MPISSPYIVYLFLIPLVGLIYIYRKQQLQNRAKLTTGVELTYQSSLRGLFYLVASYVLVRILNFALTEMLSPDLIKFKIKVLIFFRDPFNFYLSVAFLISYLHSLTIRKNDDLFLGDSKQGEVWFSLLQSEPKTDIIVFLEDDTFFVGTLVSADLNENIPFEERIIRIYPLFSGTRNADGQIIFSNGFTPIEELSISQARIISFSKYFGQNNLRPLPV